MRFPGILTVALVLGLAIRVSILWNTAGLGPQIVDEQHYVQLATSLVTGKGFAWSTGELTSIRPPLFPALMAGIWAVTDAGDLQAVRLVQCLLALLTSGVVYQLGRRAFSPAVGAWAAAITWLSPSLIFLNATVLSETLFTLLLTTFVLLAVMLVERPTWWRAFACGLALGLGALTRSVLWPVPLLLCPLLLVLIPTSIGTRLALAGLVFAGYAAVVAPWAVRNTRLQGVVTIVDTMGGMNLRMGNYEYTPEDRMWDAVSMTGDKNWAYALAGEPGASTRTQPFTEGMKDKWAQRKALEYMSQHPGTTIRRAAIKFADFWGLDRSFVAGVQQGLYHPPSWFVWLATALTLVACVIVILLGCVGFWMAVPAWRVHVLLLLPVVVITGVHTIVFGHPQYHDPLIPILAVYGAAAVTAASDRHRRYSRPALIGATASVLLLLAIWGRQVILVDGARVKAFLSQFI